MFCKATDTVFTMILISSFVAGVGKAGIITTGNGGKPITDGNCGRLIIFSL